MPAVTGMNYILNIYIHKVMIQKHVCCIDENHETCVSFKLLERIEFDISQPNDPKRTNACACIIKFEKGKSCLFSMSDAITKNLKDTKLYLEVMEKLSCTCLPSKLVLGTLEIDIEEQFAKVNSGELVKPIKGFYSVKNVENEEVAVLDMTFRLSKLNDINLNDFTMNEAGNIFSVKGIDDSNSYTFMKTNNPSAQQNSCDPAKPIRDIGEVCCSHGIGNDSCCGLKNFIKKNS